MMESYLIYLPILYIIQYLLHNFRFVKKKKRNTSHPNPIQVVINFTYTFKNVKVLRDQIMNHNNRKIHWSVPLTRSFDYNRYIFSRKYDFTQCADILIS